jgi:hypothetical protein
VFESMLHTLFILPEDRSKPTGLFKRKQRTLPVVRLAASTAEPIAELAADGHLLERTVADYCQERTPFALLLLRCVLADGDGACLRDPSREPYGVALTTRLKDGIRRYDRVLWEGGECFAVILNMISDPHQASLIADRIRHRLNHPLLVERCSVECGVRLGQAIYPEDGGEARLLIQKAELALSEPTSTVSTLRS